MSSWRRRVSALLGASLAVAAVAMTATAGGPTPDAASGPKLETILDLDPRFGVQAADPWSPDGRYLALLAESGPGDTSGIYVFDMDQPSAPPRRIMRSTFRYFVWSPDSKWLAILLSSRSSEPIPAPAMGSLVASPIDGGQGVSLIVTGNVRPFSWARDGRIVFWRRPAVAGPEDAPPLPALGPNARQCKPFSALEWGVVRHITPGTKESQRVSRASRGGIDSRRDAILFDFYDKSGTEYDVLEDRNGKLLGLLACGETPSQDSTPIIGLFPGIQWTSVSPSLRHVIGFSLPVLDEDELEGSHLVVTTPQAARAGGVDGTALGRHGYLPRFSPRDPLIVYQDPMTGRLHVDRLVDSDP